MGAVVSKGLLTTLGSSLGFGGGSSGFGSGCRSGFGSATFSIIIFLTTGSGSGLGSGVESTFLDTTDLGFDFIPAFAFFFLIDSVGLFHVPF